jgi:hypothetical protein
VGAAPFSWVPWSGRRAPCCSARPILAVPWPSTFYHEVGLTRSCAARRPLGGSSRRITGCSSPPRRTWCSARANWPEVEFRRRLLLIMRVSSSGPAPGPSAGGRAYHSYQIRIYSAWIDTAEGSRGAAEKNGGNGGTAPKFSVSSVLLRSSVLPVVAVNIQPDPVSHDVLQCLSANSRRCFSPFECAPPGAHLSTFLDGVFLSGYHGVVAIIPYSLMMKASPQDPIALDTVRAAAVLSAVVVLSTLTDMLRIRCIIDVLSPPIRRRRLDSKLERRIQRAVDLASKVIPRSTCGARALTMYALLARQRYASEIMVGVWRTPEGRHSAHAWIVNSSGTVISETHGQMRLHCPVQIPLPHVRGARVA